MPDMKARKRIASWMRITRLIISNPRLMRDGKSGALKKISANGKVWGMSQK